jgi:dethiobiotin synthetase
MSAFFVTATGTDLGKSFVACGLVAELKRRGRKVDALKPVMSGFDPARAAKSDAGLLLRALGREITPATLDAMAPWRYAAPLSPDMAARLEGKAVDVPALIEFCRRAMAAKTDLVIEGVGGIMAPLTPDKTVLDWMEALRLPLLLVAGSYLGSLSHTLSALDVLARRNLAVKALVVSESAGSTVPLPDTVASLRGFASKTEIVALPRLAGWDQPHAAFSRLADLI